MIAITRALLVVILPIVPTSSLLLHSIVHLLLIAVRIFFIGLRLLLIPLLSSHHVLIFKVTNFLKCHCRLIGILLPYLCYFLHFLVDHSQTRIITSTGIANHTLVNFLWLFNLPHFHFGNGLRYFFLVLLLILHIFLDWLFVLQDYKLFLNTPQLTNTFVYLQRNIRSDGFPLLRLLLYKLSVFISALNIFFLLHILDQFFSRHLILQFVLFHISPWFKDTWGK